MAFKFKKIVSECHHISLDRVIPEERKMAAGQPLIPWFVCLDCGEKFFAQIKDKKEEKT